jgi:hypothetical protein
MPGDVAIHRSTGRRATTRCVHAAIRRRAAPALVIVTALVACESGSTSGCVIGPCDTTGGDSRTPVVAGFPGARVFAGVGRLAVGDEVTLHAIRIGRAEDPCTGADTLKTNVQWGVSNSAVATITPLSDGGVRVRAVSQGTFQMLMREGGSGALSPSFDTKIVFPCPAGSSFSSIGVSP